MPNSISNCFTCCERVLCATFDSRAASVKLSVVAALTKYLNCLISIFVSFAHCKHKTFISHSSEFSIDNIEIIRKSHVLGFDKMSIFAEEIKDKRI